MRAPDSATSFDIESLPPKIDRATMLARQARRVGLITALRSRPLMPLTQMICLVSSGKYADDLRELHIADLAGEVSRMPLPFLPGEPIEDAVLRVFRVFEGQWLSSGFFTRYLGLERWTAQKICRELAGQGLLERTGKTSGRRYRFVHQSSRRQGCEVSAE